MEKRFVLFLIISFVLIMVYPYLLGWFGIVQPPPLEKSMEEFEKPQQTQTIPLDKRPRPTVPSLLPASEKRITVETPLFKVTLSTRGGSITGWELKQYDIQASEQGPINLYQPNLEAIPVLGIETGDIEVDKELVDAVFHFEGKDLYLDENRTSGTVRFILEDPERGLYISKKITFYHDRYDAEVEFDVRGVENIYRTYLGTNFGIVSWDGGERGFVGFIGPLAGIGGDVEKFKPPKIGPEVRIEGKTDWLATQDKYFIGALIPTGQAMGIIRKNDDKSIAVGLELPATAPANFRLYAGPKEFDRLSALGVGLEDSIDFGWFMFGSWSLVRAIAKPLFHFLQFLYEYTHNYGLSIIFLTIVVRSLFIPLMHKSHKAMKAMQVLQPEMAALQKKYKDDREKLNREMMGLYKKHGANPLSGCLPMFLQLPVFVALFNVLYTAIELRQAPFCCWIVDLSSKDPYYVLPIIMGASMMLQQKMQPTTMDPRQAKLFLFMPVIFTVLFLNFPSGLVLYWLTNNLLTILQQYVTIKYLTK